MQDEYCPSYPSEATPSTGVLGIDYLYVHYCVFDGYPAISYLVIFTWLLAVFFFLGSTADGYFSPTLASISDKLHIPYNIAGVTFLAFGNGAPDVFSSLAAFSSGIGTTGTNELLGGAMFVSTVVVGSVSLVSTAFVQAQSYSRDVIALILSLALIPALNYFSTSWQMLCFLFFYVLYVGVVIAPQCMPVNTTKERATTAEYSTTSSGAFSPSDGGMLAAFWHSFAPEESSQDDSKVDFSDDMTSSEFTSAVHEDYFEETEEELSAPLLVHKNHSNQRRFRPSFLRSSSGLPRVADAAYYRHLRWRWQVQKRLKQVLTDDQNIAMKALALPQAAAVAIRDVTIPLVDVDTWSRFYATAAVLTVPQLVLFATGYTMYSVLDIPLWIAGLVVSSFFASMVSFTTHRSRPPSSKLYSAIFLLLAFTSCVCWIYTFASELMALLVAIGVITNASTSILGLTVLSWGNSIGDLVTDVSVARAGFPEMAIAGCLGGPVFNILVGLGGPLTIAYIRTGTATMALDKHTYVALGFLLTGLFTTWLVMRKNKFFCPPWYGRFLILYYGAFTVTNLMLAIVDGE